MKKLSAIVPILLLALAPLACKGPVVTMPTPPFLGPTPTFTSTATATATATPACGLTNLILPTFVTAPVLPLGTLVPFVTFTPTPISTAGTWFLNTPTPSPTPGPVAVHSLFLGIVVQNLAQWQYYFGSATPPVNFATQMVLLYIKSSCCDGGELVQGACLTSTELDLTVTENGAIPCNAVCSIWGGVAVPATTLPVYITELTYYPGF